MLFDIEVPQSLLKLAVGVLITIGFISLCIVEWQRGSKAVESNLNQTLDQSEEWETSDFRGLLNGEMTGLEVVSAIKKYKSDYTVYVGTQIYDKSSSVPSDICDKSAIGTNYYIDPVTTFTCAVKSQNANGVVTAIEFTPTAGYNDADGKLASILLNKLGSNKTAFGISASDNLDTMVNKIYAANPSTLKSVLADLSQNSGDYNSMTYQELCNEIQDRIDTLEEENSELEQSHTFQYAKQEGIDPGGLAIFDFLPAYLIITCPANQEFAQVWIRQSNNTYRLSGSGAGAGDEYGSVTISGNLAVSFDSFSKTYQVTNTTDSRVSMEAFSSEELLR